MQNLGHHFISKTDSEVVLAAFTEWGEECLNRFVGMWALVIYDNTSHELFLSRDRYGIKPLYYWFSPTGDLYFASEIKQFTVVYDWQAKINPQRVYDYLLYSFTDHTDETMFKGVFQLPSGSFFKSNIDKIKPDHTGRLLHKKWYKLKRDPFKGSFNEAVEVFREYFKRAVKEHLNADVPVGTALSGGLDSSSIVCQINRMLIDQNKAELQKTFSSCSFEGKYDEKKWMDIVINQTKVDAHFIFPSLQDVFKLTPDVLWFQDEPYQSQSAFLAFNVFRLASDNGIKVLLNGQGADEYLGGYGQFTSARYADLIKSLKFKSLLKDIAHLHELGQVPIYLPLRGSIYKLLPSFIHEKISKYSMKLNRVMKLLDTNKIGVEPIHPFDNIPVKAGNVRELSEHYTFYSTLPKYLRWKTEIQWLIL